MDGSAEPEFKSFAKGRKTYKTIRGEPIWPPHLEAALFEGLQRYEPVQSRETLLLGRFPYRNQFLSDYIFQKTGSRRTQKQVGSRIQVLKESPDGRRLLQKFNLKHHDSKRWTRDAMSSPSPDPCNTACGTEDIVSPAGLTYPVYASSSHSSLSCSPSEVTVFIDFIPEFIPPSSSWQPSTCKSRGSPSPPLFTGLDLLGVGCAPPSVRLDSGIEGSAIFCPSRNPRLLRAIDPTVSFVSRSTITARSICAVYMDGVCIHTDETPLRLGAFKLPVESSCDQRLYSVALVPEYWDDICRSEGMHAILVTARS
ncbi:hypothetical protein PLICRDRAFT_693654 [Plicaturopsis crispa FD-325 SS-3]|nr:hypothetical protein PLICRDRAFT_693654 [Plicaturopsis crispa FD-325 SS-3]